MPASTTSICANAHVVKRTIFFLSVLVLFAHWPFAHADSVSSGKAAVVILSPVPGFATNASTVRVDVQYSSKTPSESRNLTQLRLLLDGSAVGIFDVQKKTKKGAHTFHVDVAARPDALVTLEAILVRVKVPKERKGSRYEEDEEENAKASKDKLEHVEARSPIVSGVIDRTPPQARIVSPLNNQIVRTPSVSIDGFATDNLSGLASLSVNDIATTAVSGGFSVPLSLPFSVNEVTITATDRAGNASTLTQRVLYSTFSVAQPLIQSKPPQAAIVGKQLQYPVIAASADPGRLVFSLLTSPSGMAIDSRSGLVTWSPGLEHVGIQSVKVAATDGSGETIQEFTLPVFETRHVASQRVLAAAGGVITVDDPASALHGLSVTIPPNALITDTTIQLSELRGPSSLGGAERFFLKGISIEPDGTLLSVPATIRLPYNVAEFKSGLGITAEEFLGAYFWDAATATLEGLANFNVDATSHAVTGSVPHFSVYFIANQAQLCPPPTPQAACADEVPTPSAKIPAIVVHGFQVGGLGDEGTWGRLRYLLNKLDLGGDDRIDAWRFDWDSRSTLFEISAERLAHAVREVTQAANQPQVNIVAHSFGGILIRTYLQGRAGFRRVPYRGDVKSAMTLGTPHQGIGGLYSTLADLCASAPGEVQSPTCFQTNTGAPTLPGEGEFLRELNSQFPAQIQHVIRGQVLDLRVGLGGLSIYLRRDDGLITSEGSNVGGVLNEVFAQTASDAIGLCHTGALFYSTCVPVFPGGQRNIAMAEVSDKGHPLWQKICTFLGSDDDKCKPQLNVLRTLGGTVTSDVPGINCGTTCATGYNDGQEVTLTAQADTGFKFDGWSISECPGTGPCPVKISNSADTIVIATFSELAESQPQYTFSQIVLPGAPTGLGQTGIGFNSKGDIVYPVRGSPDESVLNATRFALEGAFVTSAMGINDNRVIVGTTCATDRYVFLPPYGNVDGCSIFITTAEAVEAARADNPNGPQIVRMGAYRLLHPKSPTGWFNPNGINNNGDIAGFYQAPPEWEDNGFVLAGTNSGSGSFSEFGSAYTYPGGINDLGAVVGFTCPTDGPSCRPFLHDPNGSAGPLPPLPLTARLAGINNSGVIVGEDPGGSFPGGFVVLGQSVFPLPPLSENVGILGINNLGQILGSSGDNHFIATPTR